MAKEKNTYQKAFNELQKIVDDIDSESIQLDVLPEKIKKATELIKFCQEKLRATEDELEKFLSD